jgi:hypothetical protein
MCSVTVRPPPKRIVVRAELALIDAIRSGGVQKVLISGIDRVGRTLADLVTFM